MNDRITTQFCDKIMSGDISTEISMPDYEPEVRRLLKVSVKTAPPEGFFDGNRIGVNGRIIYNILYSANDGELYSTEAEETYELAEAAKPSEKCPENQIFLCEVQPESLVSRATAPRKLSLKCRLKGRVRGFCEKELTENTTYVENPSCVRRLKGQSSYSHVFSPISSEFKLSEDFVTEVGGDLRVVSYDAVAVAEEIETSRGSAAVKGTLHMTLLVSCDDGETAPFTLHKKIPFAEVIDADGISPACETLANVCCTNAVFSVEDSRIFCEATVCIELCCSEERLAEYTRDLFSTEVSSQTTEKRCEFPCSSKSVSGNFSVNLRKNQEEEDWLDGAEIINATSNAVVKSIEFDGKKSILVGETTVDLLTKVQNEYSAKEFKIPFRYETESVDGEPMFAEFSITALPPTAKIESGRLLCDCELYTRGRMFSKSELTALDEVIFGDYIDKDSTMTVCFPSPTDTVWDIAKRYHIPTEEIISQNRSSFPSTSDADESTIPAAPLIL